MRCFVCVLKLNLNVVRIYTNYITTTKNRMKYCAVYLISTMSFCVSLLTSSVSKDNVVHTEGKQGIFKGTREKKNMREKREKSFLLFFLFFFFLISHVTGETSEKMNVKGGWDGMGDRRDNFLIVVFFLFFLVFVLCRAK